MPKSLKGISRRGWLKLLQWTFFGTLWCVIISVTYNYAAFASFGGDALRQGLVSATVLPIVLAGPLFFYLTLKLRELAIANHKLSVVASTDNLTGCLNRGAFTEQVSQKLEERDDKGNVRGGAMLIIDADHFKAINDRHGHHQGDEALRIISRVIRTSVRAADIVGRLGGEEFGVFLPGANQDNAAGVAERIRNAVAETSFLPEGNQTRLSVSIGGASYSTALEFTDLFKLADAKLYRAKNSGRNRVDMLHVDDRVPAGDCVVH